MCPEMTAKDEGGEYFSLSIGFTMPPPWHTTGSLLQRNWWEALESTVQRWYMGWRRRTTSKESGGLKGCTGHRGRRGRNIVDGTAVYVRHCADYSCYCLLWIILNQIASCHLNLVLCCWLSYLDASRPRFRCEYNLINTRLVFIQNLHSRNLHLMYDSVSFRHRRERYLVVRDVLAIQLSKVYRQWPVLALIGLWFVHSGMARATSGHSTKKTKTKMTA